MTKSYINLSKEQFQAFTEFPIDTPLQMLNLLRFRKSFNEMGLTGAEQYQLYMKEALPFFERSKAKIIFYGVPKFTLIGPSEELEWDKILIVEYATKNDFLQMITSKAYPAHQRTAALEDSRLIFCSPVQK